MADQEPSPLRFAFRLPGFTWEQERDARLSHFIRTCLTHVNATGCTDERRWAAGVGDVFAEWDKKRVLSDNDPSSSQINALGWALRCIARSAWRDAPGWEDSFHPRATSPETASEPHS
ncbi:hypothetical protein BJY54_006085 [Streptomyces nodosus]|uniref:Uncharacterized protein n=1 Tax=Streptomyces nodosus TaxID=40318 RepID=A0A0B5DL31_9ACTN|nr:hypothetical protein SNOD_30890 [Streptomyces nodosus]MBB4795473.1 hypothetical protein [Streptomyces nodosus]QEV42412.1 hypothetical protein CP978_31200 [Streptomyces nodosus]